MNPGHEPVNSVEKDPFNLGVFLEADDYFAACDNSRVTKEDLQGLVKSVKANNESVTTFPTWDNNTSGPESSATSGYGHSQRSPNSQGKWKERECGTGMSRWKQRRQKQNQRRGFENEKEKMCISCCEAGRPNEVVRTHTMLDENSGRLLCKFLTGEKTFK